MKESIGVDGRDFLTPPQRPQRTQRFQFDVRSVTSIAVHFHAAALVGVFTRVDPRAIDAQDAAIPDPEQAIRVGTNLITETGIALEFQKVPYSSETRRDLLRQPGKTGRETSSFCHRDEDVHRVRQLGDDPDADRTD